MNMIQRYAPTTEKPIDEFEQWYKDLEKFMKMMKKEDINIVLSDCNDKIGKERFLNIEFGVLSWMGTKETLFSIFC